MNWPESGLLKGRLTVPQRLNVDRSLEEFTKVQEVSLQITDGNCVFGGLKSVLWVVEIGVPRLNILNVEEFNLLVSVPDLRWLLRDFLPLRQRQIPCILILFPIEVISAHLLRERKQGWKLKITILKNFKEVSRNINKVINSGEKKKKKFFNRSKMVFPIPI